MRSQSDTNRRTLSALSRVVNQLYISIFTRERKTSVDNFDRFLIRDGTDGFNYKYVLAQDTVLGEGVNNFITLLDTPSSYIGKGGYMLMVNSTPDEVEFVNPSTYDITNFTLQTTLGGYTISDTKVNFNTALSDGTFVYSGGAFHDGFSDYVADEHVAHSGVSIATQHSITGGGNITTSRTLNLVNDETSPGNDKHYGTNNSGTKGWYTDIPQYGYWIDGSVSWRMGVRSNNFVRDKTLTETGFGGVEDVDWENVYEEN